MEHVGPTRLRALLDAVLAVGSDLDLKTVLRRIVRSAAELADAKYAALGVLNDEGTHLIEFITVGIDDATIKEIGPYPRGHGILGLLILDPRPLRLPNMAEHPDSYGFPPHHPPMTSFLGVPIRLHDRVFGNLYLTDKQSAEAFTDIDEEVLVSLASAAAIAIENARLHARVESMALVEDRERIARDLHDTVIQRLFAAGLNLQSMSKMPSDVIADRISSVVDELDAIIRDVRSVIFKLEDAGVPATDTRTSMLQLVHEAGRVLGFQPEVQLDDSLNDNPFSSDVRHALLSTLREGLSNVARHAQARAVTIWSGVVDEELKLEIVDDGVGLSADSDPGGKGLANAAARAEELSGTLTVANGARSGTILTWCVPLKTSG